MSLFESLRQLHVGMFHEKGESVIGFLCRSKISKQVWLSKYNQSFKLSELDANEKQKLKEYVNEKFKGETPQFRLDACKIILTLNNSL